MAFYVVAAVVASDREMHLQKLPNGAAYCMDGSPVRLILRVGQNAAFCVCVCVRM